MFLEVITSVSVNGMRLYLDPGWVGLMDSVGYLERTKSEERHFCFLLQRWSSHLLLSLDNGTQSSQAFGLWKLLDLLVRTWSYILSCLVLSSFDCDYLHLWFPWVSSLQMEGLGPVHLHEHESPFSQHISCRDLYMYLTGRVLLGNSD